MSVDFLQNSRVLILLVFALGFLVLTASGQQATSAKAVPLVAASATQGPDPSQAEKLALPTPRDPVLPTLWIVGDSTVRNGHGDGANGQWGWGEPIVSDFDTSKINVVNRAIGGRSSRTYITEGHWRTTLNMMKRGDFLLIQFGHNDSGPLDDTARARGSLPGVGDETREIENPILKRHETVHTFGWYLRQYVEEAKARGVTPILCTLIPRKTWANNHIVRSGSESYGGWTRAVASQEHVALIDLNEIIAREYDAMGQAAVEPMFGDPHTHTSLAGAQLNARAVVLGLKLLHPDPLAAFLSPATENIKDTLPPATP